MPSSNHGVEPSNPRWKHFRLRNNIGIYGGFSGTENPAIFDLNERNFELNETILHGYVGDTFYHNGSSYQTRCYRIVYNPEESPNINNSAILDGFTIMGAYTNPENYFPPDYSVTYASGIFLDHSSPTIRNIKSKNNRSYAGGAGLSSFNSSPIISNCLFEENTGAIDINFSTVSITNTVIRNNDASAGSGIVVTNSEANIENVLIYNNESLNGTIYINNATLNLTNVTLAYNTEINYAGIYDSDDENY